MQHCCHTGGRLVYSGVQGIRDVMCGMGREVVLEVADGMGMEAVLEVGAAVMPRTQETIRHHIAIVDVDAAGIRRGDACERGVCHIRRQYVAFHLGHGIGSAELPDLQSCGIADSTEPIVHWVGRRMLISHWDQ